MKKSRYYLVSLIKLLLIFVLAGCVLKGKISPKNLPDATLNKPYYAEIYIHIGPVIDRIFDYRIEPENSGLELAPFDLDAKHAYNHLTIKGTPLVTGTIVIKMHGLTLDIPPEQPAEEFEKTYTINVEQ